MSDIVLLIFEGEKTELQIFDNIKFFFGNLSSRSELYAFYKTNLHILWEEMKDDPDLDIVEILRSRSEENKKTLQDISRDMISQVFLFFDSDLHAARIKSVHSINLKEALEYFNEETEHGKLYLSYPMVEAIKDCYKDKEKCYETCIWPIEKSTEYKAAVGRKSDFSDLRPNKFNMEAWHFIIGVNYEKATCLVHGENGIPGYTEAKKITQRKIYENQFAFFIKNSNTVIILSAFPFFIVEYFSEEKFKGIYNQIVSSFTSKKCLFECITDEIEKER